MYFIYKYRNRVGETSTMKIFVLGYRMFKGTAVAKSIGVTVLRNLNKYIPESNIIRYLDVYNRNTYKS